MDAGAVVAAGPHGALVTRSETYARLWEHWLASRAYHPDLPPGPHERGAHP
ncbi:MAG: hypothetical protein WD080_08825 [Egibacteraceae bacterium]